MAIMTHAKSHFNWLMLTLIFGIWASESPPPQAWRTTEKAGPDRVKAFSALFFFCFSFLFRHPYGDSFHHNFDMIFQCFSSSVETDLFLQREVPSPRFSELDSSLRPSNNMAAKLYVWSLSAVFEFWKKFHLL